MARTLTTTRSLTSSQLLTALQQTFSNGALNGWAANNSNATVAVSTAQTYNGNTYSLLLTSTGIALTQAVLTNAFSAKPGTTLYFTGWAYATAIANINFNIGPLGSSYPSTTVVATLNSWSFISFSLNVSTYTLTSQTTAIYAGFTSTAANQTCYFSQFSVTSTRPTNYTRTIAAISQLLTTNQQGFENNSTNSWTTGVNSATVAASSTQAHTGTYSLAVTSTASGQTEPYSPLITGLYPGIQLTFSAWAYSANGLTISLQIDAKLGSTFVSHAFGPSIVTSASTWTYISMTMTMPTGTNAITALLQFTATAGSQVVYWDDISITSSRGNT
jgi:hypothetical protein